MVLGASGFVGFSLFEALTKRTDLDVWGTYQSNKYQRFKNDHNLVQADLTKPSQLALVTKGFDVVIQAAAYST